MSQEKRFYCAAHFDVIKPHLAPGDTSEDVHPELVKRGIAGGCQFAQAQPCEAETAWLVRVGFVMPAISEQDLSDELKALRSAQLKAAAQALGVAPAAEPQPEPANEAPVSVPELEAPDLVADLGVEGVENSGAEPV